MANDHSIISARGLTRAYRKRLKAEGLSGSFAALFNARIQTVTALADFDLEVARGELIGLIGPNGAGKTTLVKLLSGLMKSDAGSVEVLGHTPFRRREEFLSRIALVMGQKSQLWWDLPARDSFLLNKAIYGLSDSFYRASLDRLCGALDAGAYLDAPVRSLSLGERMRLEFIAAMLHEPELVFLDEPTIGLDAPAQKRIREFIKAENVSRGLTVILTSHYMEDIRKLCPRTVLMIGGRKTFDGATATMLESVRDRKLVRARFDAEPDAELLAGLPGEAVERSTYGILLSVKPEEVRAALAALTAMPGLADLGVEEEELADSVEKLYVAGGRP